MKNKKHLLHKSVCAFMALAVALQVNATTVYALENALPLGDTLPITAQADSLVEKLSQNGNVVTQYVNQEDQKLKTIVWAKGITPPNMGGENSDFIREETYVQGQLTHVEYKAPYIPNQGWYDVNKTESMQVDKNLCFAAAASNTLHWWMDQNTAYIDQYLAEHPEYEKAEKLKNLRHSFKNQQDSEVYKLFVRQFANKPDGYWPDILQDQFINGYYPKPNGGTNDSDADRDKLIKDGPDPKGGFFYDVFGVNRLTQRRWYDFGYDAISSEIQQRFIDGDMVLLTYDMGRIAHVITLWGAEFDTNGKISGVYFTDSDDDKNQGMQRYNLVNKGGKAIVGASISGNGSAVTSLQMLSLGKDMWEDALHIEPKTLELQWSDTQLVYNGSPQKPSVSATNIDNGDEVVLSVQGEQTNAGTYTATVTISGAAAKKYKLPSDATKEFVIHKAPTPQIEYPTAEKLLYGKKLKDSTLLGGSAQYGNFVWENEEIVADGANNGYPVLFIPNPVAFQNYELPTETRQMVSVQVEKAVPALTVTAAVEEQLESRRMLLTAKGTAAGYGANPTGTVKFVATTPDMQQFVLGETSFAENGTAEFVWDNPKSMVYQVKAVYEGNHNYTAAESSEITVDVEKLPQKDFSFAPISEKTYGDTDFVLDAIGGNGNGALIFESDDPSIVSISGNVATIHKAGTVILTATKQGDETYNEATTVISLTVAKKTVVITAEDKLDVKVGEQMPEFTYTAEGLVNGDTFIREPAFTVQAKNTDVAGQYTIVPSNAILTNAENYTVVYKNGILDVVEVSEEIIPQPTEAPTPTPTVKPVPTPTPEVTPVATPEPQPTDAPEKEPIPQSTALPEEHPVPNTETNQQVAQPVPPVQKPNATQSAQKDNTVKPTETPQSVLQETAEPTSSPAVNDDTAMAVPTEKPEKETIASTTDAQTNNWAGIAVLSAIGFVLVLALAIWYYMKKRA